MGQKVNSKCSFAGKAVRNLVPDAGQAGKVVGVPFVGKAVGVGLLITPRPVASSK